MNEKIIAAIRKHLTTLWSEIVDLKENQDKSNTFKVVASTEDVDRSGEVIKLDGWDDTDYKNNPVVMWDHNYGISSIAGKMTSLYKEGGKLMLEWIFTEATEIWRTCKDLYNAWFLKAVSVWFIVKQRNENNRDIIEKAELLEISFVAIPCNQNALSTEWKTLIKKWVNLWILKKEAKESKEDKVLDEEEKKYLAIEKRLERKFEEKYWKEIDSLKKTLWTLADGNALPGQDESEDGNSEKQYEAILKSFQGFSKAVSEGIHQMKKAK